MDNVGVAAAQEDFCRALDFRLVDERITRWYAWELYGPGPPPSGSPRRFDAALIGRDAGGQPDRSRTQYGNFRYHSAATGTRRC